MEKPTINNYMRLAKVKSDKPAYTKKEKTEKGYVWTYTPEHIEKRWKEKKEKMKKLEKDLTKFRREYEKDLNSDDEKTRAIAAVIGVIDNTSMRIGNERSAKEEETYGATTLKVKHIKVSGGKIKFDFPGKGAIEQHVELTNKKVIKVIKDLMKGKKADDFIFEVDGKKIWDRTVNRYLEPHGISAKDLRGFHSNRLMKEMLKKKDFKDALEEVAEIVGHEPATLKNQYLDPDLVEKYEGKDKKDDKKKKAGISIRAEQPITDTMFMPSSEDVTKPITFTSEEDEEMVRPISTYPLATTPAIDVLLNVSNIHGSARVSPMLAVAWQILAPFLPPGSRLRSSNRTWGEQKIIIRNYWANKRWRTVRGNRSQYSVATGTGFFATMFPDVAKIDGSADVRNIPEVELRKAQIFMTQKYNAREKIEFAGKTRSIWQANGPWNPLKIAWKKSRHIGGNALDVDMAPLKNIEQSVKYVANEPSLAPFITISGTAFEPDQNNFHISISRALSIPKEVHEATLRNYLHGYPLISMVSTQRANKPALSKRAELNKDDSKWVQSIKPISSRIPATMSGLIEMSKETRKARGIKPAVNLNDLIINAWMSLRPFLPDSARLTSGSRTPEDQKRILRNYYKKATGRDISDIKDDNETWLQISRFLKKHHGLIVGPPWTKSKYSHLKGTAIDVSGADLDRIAHAVRVVSQEPRIPVKFRKPLIEPENRAVHIGIESATYDAVAVKQISDEFKNRVVASISKCAGEEVDMNQQINEIYEDFLASNPPYDIVQKFENAFGMHKCASDSCFGIEKDNEPEYDVRLNIYGRMISKRAEKDKPKVGVFMKLPRELAKQFPSLGEHDDSVPHITALFIGLVPEEHEILLEEVVRRIAMEHDPFELALDEKISYFPATKHSDDCKIAKLNIVSTGLKKLHKTLKKAITNAKIDIDDHFPNYNPHVTLEYMKPPKEKYDTDIPSGSWTADKIEIWNGDKKTIIQLGRKKKASISVRIDDLSANKPAFGIREIGAV